MSLWIDLIPSGGSARNRAEADPLLTREKLTRAASLYLGSHNARDSPVDAFQAGFVRLPSVRIRVGEDEIVLDNSMIYENEVAKTGLAIDLYVWKGMTHVLTSGVENCEAEERALAIISNFILRD